MVAKKNNNKNKRYKIRPRQSPIENKNTENIPSEAKNNFGDIKGGIYFLASPLAIL